MMSVIKCKNLVVAGDAYCGKTSILKEFIEGGLLAENVTTVNEQFVTNFEINGKLVQLFLWDTPGEHIKSDSMQSNIYQHSDVILLTFAIDYEVSLRNIEEKWYPEVRKCCPKVPIILVGNKLDLRNKPLINTGREAIKKPPVTMEEGQAVANKINAFSYVECSAKTKDGVSMVFELAAKAALRSDRKKRWKVECVIL